MDVQALMHFRDLAQRKIQELTSTVDLYLSGNREAALAVVRSGAGKRDMDELRRNTAAIEKNLDTAMAPVRRQVIVYRDIFFGLGLATLLFTIIGLSSLFSWSGGMANFAISTMTNFRQPIRTWKIR